MPTVNAIESNCGQGSAAGRVYYPLWFVMAAVSWRRLLMRPRTERIWVCVDGVRGVAYRVDSPPAAREVNVAEDEVLPLGLDEEEAVSKAGSLARWWARTRLFSWWGPAVKLAGCRLYHKVYVVGKDSSGHVLRDSVSGDNTTL